MERPTAELGGRTVGGGRLFVLAGPCVLESESLALEIAGELARIARERDLVLAFKASYDKANRTRGISARGPGLERGLSILARVREETGLPVLTDVHLPQDCAPVAEVADVLQVPAFLCRQTDLLHAAADTGRTVNVKKGQFLAPWDMRFAVEKCTERGNPNILVTERGFAFGYGRLVVDMAGLAHLSAAGKPVVFDATHSVQEPGTGEGRTLGNRAAVPSLARAAVATGQVDGLFFEVHPEPDTSPSDGPNMVALRDFPALLDDCLRIQAALRRP